MRKDINSASVAKIEAYLTKNLMKDLNGIECQINGLIHFIRKS
jgi:hypothetical protein